VQKALCLKRSWSDFDPQAYYLYGEDQNHETSFKDKALQAVVDSWCKIQVLFSLLMHLNIMEKWKSRSFIENVRVKSSKEITR